MSVKMEEANGGVISPLASHEQSVEKLISEPGNSGALSCLHSTTLPEVLSSDLATLDHCLAQANHHKARWLANNDDESWRLWQAAKRDHETLFREVTRCLK